MPSTVIDIAPNILALVGTHVINQRTVEQATMGETWLEDINGDISFTAQIQLMHLRHAIATVQRDTLAPDIFSWPCAGEEGKYSAKSTYARLCEGLTHGPAATAI